MKNLRKLLVLVLVFAMVLSIGAISASAAFTDTASTKYGEAIGVLSGIGVINGTTSTTFDPTGSLTRESAAKIITYMLLGPTNAALIKNATSQKFADVAPDRWSAGYIEYCANAGIIGGAGDGTFNPTGALSTAAFSKMLLCALGYKADVEGLTGTSWAINTASLAVTAGVYDSGITIGTNVCTREQAAQLALKALQATMVQYSGGTAITIGNATITMGATRSDVMSAIDSNANIVGGTAVNGQLSLQFGEKVFTGLKKAVGPDDFGRPNSVTWTNNNVFIASGSIPATLTYTTGVTSAKIFADLGLAANALGVATYTDGKNNTGTFDVKYDGTARIGGNGTTTEVYYIQGVITIVVINTYNGTITAVTPATAVAKANVTVTAGTTKLGSFATGAFTTTGFTVNDIIYYTVAQTAGSTYVVKSVAAATKATLLATSYVTNTSFTSGGKTYSYNAKTDGYVNDYTTPHDVYLDGNGFVILVTGATVAANYAVVLAAGTSADGLGTDQYNAKLLLPDGTQKVVVVKDDATSPDLRGSIVSYTVSATTGVYTLTDPTSTDVSAKTLALTKNVSKFTWNSVDYYANANTVYLVRTGTSPAPYTYTAYTGVANVPSISGTASGQVVVNSTTNFVSIVYITGATVSSGAAGTVYLTGTYSTTNDSVKGTYYTCNAIVDSKVVTVDLGSAPTKGLYTGITYNTNNIGTVGTGAASTSATGGTTALANGVVGLGSAGYYTTSSDCVVYYVTAQSTYAIYEGIATPSSVAGILTDNNDTVIFTTNTSGLVNAIYIQTVPAT